MVETGRPAGVGGNNLNAFDGEENRRDDDTETGSVANDEEEAKAERNRLRALRRQRGDVGVSDDEGDTPDGVDGTERAHTGGEQGAGSNVSALISLLGTLSPSSLRRTFEALSRQTEGIQQPVDQADVVGSTAKRVEPAPESTTLAAISVNRSARLFDNKIKAPEAVLALIKHQHHLPLTMCTNKALKDLKKSTVKYVKVHNSRTGAKNTLVDTSLWPGEDDMCVEDWRQAWKNFLVVLGQAADAETVELFKDHFEHLCDKDEIEESFESVLKFDIEVREDFFGGARGGFVVGDVPYENRYQAICIGVVRQRQTVDRARPAFHPYNNARAPERSSYPDRRPNPEKRPFERPDGPSRPFPEGRQPAAGLFCLKCAQGGPKGHHASACTRGTLPNGKPTFSAFDSGKLVVASSGKELCLFWNINGNEPCRSLRCPGKSGHLCSFCGATHHPAVSKRCL
ncbi:hypothetical protein BDW22DRAFT_1038186 [Trametopsis cervina]|nr:hypothetical protein BDW22DRAFT_1038186 [Trametopsis cervina]